VVRLPRLVIGAPASGAGKTSVATGLLAALRSRGLAVSGHKVGPDYIDPGYHALAAGRPGRNLDPWLVGEELIEPLFLHGALTPAPADVAVVEGAVGLFDGVADRPGYASTAHVAALLRAPVVLVVDASAAGRSVAALVHGFATYDPAVRLGGVILNRVGSARHREILLEALAGIGVPVLGVLHRDDRLVTPSRHLGLVPAAERTASAVRAVQALGAVIADSLDLDAVLALARSAPSLAASAWEPPVAEIGRPAPALAGPAWEPRAAEVDRRPVVAVAGGAAFTFSYAETAEVLAAAGAEVVGFDPLVDTALPDGTAGLVLGGGFPEVHVAALAANEPLLAAVARHLAGGGVAVAECAGLLYLARTLDGAPMCGAVPADAVMTPRLTLRYREAVAASCSPLGPVGTSVRGHEFHRTSCSPVAGPSPAWRLGPDAEGWAGSRLHASYLHLHWAGVPSAAPGLVAACLAYEAGRAG